MDWFNSLSIFEQVTFVIACITSAFMIVQVIMVFFGFEQSDSFDGDADFSGDDLGSDLPSNDTSIFDLGGLKVLTLRGIVAFLAVGSWLAFALFPVIGYIVLIPAILVGALVAVLIALLMKALMKLEKVGTLDYKKAIGKTGSVYLNIPENRTGAGKIMIMIQERLLECNAMTDGEKITNGTIVKVVGMVDSDIFLVEKV